ncbi:hypothetical protein HY772_00550 [Candidatus Woesearchaeota archaeon]|nr:hypothetical protein [Candidatus Woesearchaeota archaeon]
MIRNNVCFAITALLASCVCFSCKSKGAKRTEVNDEYHILAPLGGGKILYGNKKYPYFLEYSTGVWRHPSTDDEDGLFSLDGEIKPKETTKEIGGVVYPTREFSGDFYIYISTHGAKSFENLITDHYHRKERDTKTTATLTTGTATINDIVFAYAIEQGMVDWAPIEVNDDSDAGGFAVGYFCNMTFYTEKPAPITIRYYAGPWTTTDVTKPKDDEEARQNNERLKQEALKVIKTFRWHEPEPSQKNQ